MNKETAAKITARLESCLHILSEIVQIADADCQDAEKKVIRHGIGFVLSEIQDRIADPIYRVYPELIPEGVEYQPLEGPTINDLVAAVEARGSGKIK